MAMGGENTWVCTGDGRPDGRFEWLAGCGEITGEGLRVILSEEEREIGGMECKMQGRREGSINLVMAIQTGD